LSVINETPSPDQKSWRFLTAEFADNWHKASRPSKCWCYFDISLAGNISIKLL